MRILSLIAVVLIVGTAIAQPGMGPGPGVGQQSPHGTMTAGTDSSDIGYISGDVGSIVGGSVLGGTIDAMVDIASSHFEFELDISANPGQSAFTSLTVNGSTFDSASASYTYSGGIATWSWTGSASFVNGSTYPWIFSL